ncbi:MAG: response regulator transcription factor [Desulfovibrionaceae bacterium]|jgi:two-component system LytT family response regulator|nr:response regulator transcription factor [Desulfovibrionaceae bacterium]
MRIRTLLVDDEAPARDELAYLLSEHPDVDVVQADSAGRALDLIVDNAFDLVFLDIQMPGRDGFHVLREASVLDHHPLFVFVTAYDQYAISAFEENAIDYLLKPVSRGRMSKCLDRVRNRLAASGEIEEEHAALQRLLAGMRREPRFTRVPLEQAGRIRLVDVDQVVLFETEGKKVMALTDEGSFPCHGLTTLGAVEERLAGQPFFRANRSVLMNLDRVGEFSPWCGGRYNVVMDDPGRTEVTVSRNQLRQFKECLGI